MILLIIQPAFCAAQWIEQAIPDSSGVRVDDVFFLNDTLGWAASGGSGHIFKTENGGNQWDIVFSDTVYLRSIAFANEKIGFCGSLDSTFYRTADGGITWKEISNSISVNLPGICGLSVPTTEVIYGCGIWVSPAYLIKSTDAGLSWTFLDMSNYADALVDVHFYSELEGFVVGRSKTRSEGGIVLFTSDGGESWSIKLRTMGLDDFIWKIQSPDGKHYFGSIQAQPAIDNIRFIHSSDRGKTWQLDTIRNSYHYIQMIGFMDEQNGWLGGTDLLLSTENAGKTWEKVNFSGNTFNRFYNVSDGTAFMSGKKIYKLNDAADISRSSVNTQTPYQKLKVDFYQVNDSLQIDIEYNQRTWLSIDLYGLDNQSVKSIWNGYFKTNIQTFFTTISTLQKGQYFLVVQTNEEVLHKKILKVE